MAEHRVDKSGVFLPIPAANPRNLNIPVEISGIVAKFAPL